jgi:nicotinamide-nucleotide amidase
MQQLEARVARIAALLRAHGQRLAVAESSAGGLISAALLRVAGASDYFVGGAVVYTARSRQAFLGIGAAEMEGMRAATEPYAALLAGAARQALGADWGLAETGAAGPTGNRYGDPAGHACIGVSGERQSARTVRTGIADRDANMLAFAAAALDLLEAEINAAQGAGEGGSRD